MAGETWADLDARETGVGVWVADVPGSDRLRPGARVDFTIWWPDVGRWEGRDLRVEVSEPVAMMVLRAVHRPQQAPLQT